ncbi:J domain-containing protein required for chloroplast accumulation response 1 isoform X2 [Elaeis guineensis]|uniref:J domain-containing protein required for chloroplast accumulation response 1 isoform X2 n=1 Tax=Elaeis guineensis var. tenera TaxID=51953 RepID=UPI003C6CEF0C
MEKLPDGDRALLGYAHRDPFGNPPNSAAHRNSDVDFHDVFGGPPRRSSFYECRRSRGDPLELRSSLRGRGSGEEGERSRRPWSDGEEKPVFGEMSSPARRRYLGDDFFSDIFPGSESSGTTLRKQDRDSYPSAPVSRVLSPNRPVLARCEPYVGSSSLPAQLSHSVKLAKGIDHPSFGSPTNHSLYKNEYEAPDVFSFPSSPNASVSSFTTREVRAQIDLRNESHAFYRQSPLSRPFSNRSLKTTDSAWHSTESQYQKDSLGLESYISSSQFHFSMYRWVGKGVKLVLPYNSEERNKNVSRPRKLPEVVIHGVDLASDDDNISTVTGASESQSESHATKLPNDFPMERKFDTGSASVDNHLPAKFELKDLHSDSVKESGTCKNTNKEVPVTKLDTRKSGARNLCQLFNDEFRKQASVFLIIGHEDVIIQDEETGGLSRGQRNVNDNVGFKEKAGRENSVGYIEVMSISSQDVPICMEDKMPGGRVKGKVKEFIKIFNHEGSPKCESTFETQGRRSKGKCGGNIIIEDQHSIPTTRADKKVKPSHENNGAFLATSVAVNEILNGVEKPDSNMSSHNHINNDSSSERIDITESTHESMDASVFNVEDYHYEDIEECLVEELSQEQNEPLQSNLHQDQFKISDAKIWEWSKGKEGNIRSLLSTLQYVLWPECGWKSIPLVDIIEGTAVKRAYQKALLCLHPDKLQQRGAAVHQTYIAEKVFEILQEAWTQFSSVSAL